MTISTLTPGEHYARIRSAKLWYFVRGQGPPLLVQPGGAGWGGDATPYMKSLQPLEEVRTVIYLEPRGIGQSERLPHPESYRLQEYVEDVEALREYFQLSEIAIAGHSHGGFVALQYAIQHPGNVERLVLMNTSPYRGLGNLEEWAQKRMGYAEAQAALEEVLQDESLTPDEKHRRRLLIRLPVIHFYDYGSVESVVAPLLKAMRVSAEPFEFFRSEEGDSYDVRHLLDRITAPTLIILGDDDMPHISLGAQILRDRIPDSELEIIERCGHWPMIERPQEFFEPVLRFLAHSRSTA
jgi:proline iminopeptidase